MFDEEPIRSRANPVWKTIGGILAGKDKQLILLEGERLIEDAVLARRAVGPVYFSTERRELGKKFNELDCPVFPVDPKLLCKMPENRRLDTLQLGKRSLVLVAHGISDPGNLGALARSAEAFGAAALVLTKGSTFPYSDKALRGSMGRSDW